MDPPPESVGDTADEFWNDNGDGTWMNTQTGEIQDEFGNTIGYGTETGVDANGDPLFADPNSGLQTRDDGFQPGQVVDQFTPVDVNTGPGFFASIGNALSSLGHFLFGSPANSGGNPGGTGGGGSFGGGGSSSGNSQAQQQAMQQLRAQIAAAQRANASPAVLQAMQQQLNALGGSGPSAQTILLVGGVLAIGYLVATRNSRAE